MKYQLYLALAALSAAGPASAATLNVATSGSDSNNGVSAPLRTLQKAIKLLHNGDTIVMQAGTYAAGIDIENLSNITIRGTGNVIIDGSQTTEQDAFLYFDMNGFTLDNIKVRNAKRNGVYGETSRNLTIRNCDFSNNGKTGFLSAFTSDIDIENCVASGNKAEHGIYLSCSGDRYHVKNNLLFNNQKAGLQINAVQPDNVNPNDPTADALSSDCLIEGNTLYGNGAVGGSAFNLMGVRNSTFCNNLVYNNLGGGMVMWDDDGGAAYACKNNHIYNNTFVSQTGKYGIKITAGSTGNRIFNNILSCGGGPALQADNAVQSNFNCFASGGINGGKLSAWRSSTGNDANSLEGGAGLTGDYHLGTNSPCRNAGTLLVTTDKDGGLRPQGPNPDIGCYEGAGGGTTPPPTTTGTVVYDDALTTGWTAIRADANGALTCTTPVQQGSKSIWVTLLAKTGYLKLTGPGISTSGKTVVKFCVNGGAAGGQKLILIAGEGGVQKASGVQTWQYGGVAKANGWTEYSIPLADLGMNGGALTTLRFSAPAAQKKLFIDNLRVE